VTFVWGQQPGSGSRLTVESHVQVEIRATVAPVPYVEVAREAYRTNKDVQNVVEK
jgi:hypothetical protein